MSQYSLVKLQTCVPGKQLQHLTVSLVERSELESSTDAPCSSSGSQLRPILCDARWKGAAVCQCSCYFDGTVAPQPCWQVPDFAADARHVSVDLV